uniref:translation initiation factor 2 n=1 Tax=Dixoniella grisea TaxID=35153 RepID=UPI001FCDB2FA|nr:translation initiation factor 2 [Dixoniella grisea]UNJ17114.1 translation initiation factor 2 [Dixoniella grisea]
MNPYLLKHVNIKQNQKLQNKLLDNVEKQSETIISSENIEYSDASNSLSDDISTQKGKKKKKQNFRKEKDVSLHEDTFEFKNSILKVSSASDIKVTKLEGPITLKGPIQLQELARLLNIPATEIIKFLFLKGIPSNINQMLDIPIIELIATSFNQTIMFQEESISISNSNRLKPSQNSHELQRRSPVITILGHVDHGKTTLLDKLCNTSIANNESGNITQLIYAYEIEVENQGKFKRMVILDTPGHEAFINMRLKGLNVTDIAVLVISATEGIKEQTIEILEAVKKLNISLLIAINKIDQSNANINQVKQYLASYGIVSKEEGGQYYIIPISALKGTNLDQLVTTIFQLADDSNLQANYTQNAEGTILESYLDKTKGPVAKILIQNGSLKLGNILVAGSCFAKVRAMVNTKNKKITEAGPSTPVEVWGFEEVPMSGQTFKVYDNEKDVRSIIKKYKEEELRSLQLSGNNLANLNLLSNIKSNKKLNVIIKADTQGSIEAILNMIKQIAQEKVQLNILLAVVGEVNIADIKFMTNNNAFLINFNNPISFAVKQKLKQNNLSIKKYTIIYDVLNDLEIEMKKLLDPVYKLFNIGEATVKTSFKLVRGVIAGCVVNTGILVQDCDMEVFRNRECIYKGKIDSLKKVKENVREISAGNECGVFSRDFQDWKEGCDLYLFKIIFHFNNSYFI